MVVSSGPFWGRLFWPSGEGRQGRDLHHGHGVVVEDGRDIFRGELVGCVRDEQAGLSHSTVPHHDTPGGSISDGRRGVRGGAYLMVATTIMEKHSRQGRDGEEGEVRGKKSRGGSVVGDKKGEELVVWIEWGNPQEV